MTHFFLKKLVKAGFLKYLPFLQIEQQNQILDHHHRPVNDHRRLKMSGSVNKTGPATADLLCSSNPFGNGFSTTAAVATVTAATAYSDPGCFVRTGGSSNQQQQLLLKPFASFHCYDSSHYQLFQPQPMDWQIQQSSRWQCGTTNNKTNTTLDNWFSWA